MYVICVLTEQANTFMLGMLLALTGSGSQSHGSRGPHRVISGRRLVGWFWVIGQTETEVNPTFN